MDESVNADIRRIYGEAVAREILEASKDLAPFVRGKESPLDALVNSKYYREGRLAQQVFERRVSKLNVSQSLREYVERLQYNAGKGIKVDVTPQDLAAVLTSDHQILASREKNPIIGNGIRRVYTGQTECAGSAPR